METTLLSLSYTMVDIEAAVAGFWNATKSYNIFAFSGDMGAGKTTFIRKLCDHLRVQDAVSSPTFALINEYHFEDENGTDKLIYHMDWYRLKSSEEAFSAGMEDCIDQGMEKRAYCFVEWPERAPDILRVPYLLINIETVSVTEREMEVKLIS